jgi:hypothetical protein
MPSATCAPANAYALCVDLADVGYPLGQHIAGHLVAIFVAELGRLAAGSAHRRPRIGDGPRHDAADGRRESEDVGDRSRVNELVLRARVSAMSALFGPVTRTGTFFCEMTTAQSLPRTPSDVMFAAVIALNAYSAVRCVSGVMELAGAGLPLPLPLPPCSHAVIEVTGQGNEAGAAYRLGRGALGRRRW